MTGVKYYSSALAQKIATLRINNFSVNVKKKRRKKI